MFYARDLFICLVSGLLCLGGTGLAAEPTVEKSPETPQQPEFRTWTDSSGQYKTEAGFLGLKDGRVRLQKKDGRVVDIPLDRLGKKDQEWIRQHAATKQGRKLVKFPKYGIAFQVPQGWKVVAAKALKTDMLVESHQKHADNYVKTNPEQSCFLQMETTSSPRPSICIIPGKDFISGTPESGNLKGGTGAVAGALASQLAWLVSATKSPPRVSGQVSIGIKQFAGQKQVDTEIKGDGITLVGLAITPDGRKKWVREPVTFGFAAPPDLRDQTKKVVEDILRELEKGKQDE